MTSTHDFDGKVVIVTGGGSGIGRAVALAFTAMGARVAVGDINEDSARETLTLIEQANGHALFLAADVSVEPDVENLVAGTVAHFGRLDYACNNAGVIHAPKTIAHLDTSDFDRTIAVDLRGVFLCMKHELREMTKVGRGAIVNVASVAGFLPEFGQAAYVAAKHGVVGLTKAAAFENAHLGVRINALAPGWVQTPLTAGLDEVEGLKAQLQAAIPIHRAAEPAEMAGVVLFLCSSASSYITGQVLVADGGLMVRGLLPPQEMEYA